DGTILTKNADVGEMVAPFASSASSKGSVVTLADMNSLEVEADVAESNIQKVTVGQRCEIILDAYPNKRYPGYVKKIVPTADRARATVLTKVAFLQKDNRVLPEMSARVNFFADTTGFTETQSRTVVAVPKEAITHRNGQKVVFKVEGNSVTATPVQTGRELGSMTEIISGLSQGESVVLSPPGKMVSGQKVEVSN
ncbi:MAG: efflux RND transporter periplasmic adaptor subunit, partial [Candidatus Zixiibacteriota bacterium]